MAFDDLPHQPPLQSAEARRYAATILERSAAVAKASRCVLDVKFGADYWQKLDIYLPPVEAPSGLPVLMFLHGGGWSAGYKEWMGFMAPAITGQPAIFVSVSYRLAPVHKHPAQIDDTLAAVDWVWRNIAAHGGDPDRLFIGGHSAGGHLAALATLRPDLLAARGLPRDTIKACFPVAAAFDLRPQTASDDPASKMLPDQASAAEASPLLHVAGNRTPFYIVWGERDLKRIVETGPPMVEALQAEAGPVVWEVYPGKDHFDVNVDLAQPGHPWVVRVGEWMKSPPKP